MKHSHTICDGEMTLRQVEISDLELMRQWRNSDNIRQCFIHQNEITQEQQLQWYNKYLNSDDDIMFAIDWKGQLVGAVSLYNIDGTYAEFGRLMIGALEARGLGLGKKATKAICDFGFHTLNLQDIYLEVFVDNPHAHKIYADLGFANIGFKEAHGRQMYLMIKNAS